MVHTSFGPRYDESNQWAAVGYDVVDGITHIF